VLNTIRQLAQESTMVIVTHEMSFARDVADRAILWIRGASLNRAKQKRCSPILSSAYPPVPRKIPDAVIAPRRPHSLRLVLTDAAGAE
jgi:cystine transport system ATP-binding protein